MVKINFGVCFTLEPGRVDPLSFIGVKLPTYIRLLELCQAKGWNVYILTRKTHLGDNVFKGVWKFTDDKGFRWLDSKLKMDVVYDRTAGMHYPQKEQKYVINSYDFKKLCYDKWLAYQSFKEYMPTTFWVGQNENLKDALSKIPLGKIVLKPYNGLKGIGVFIGDKKDAFDFKFLDKYPNYIAQEFVDTSNGIEGLTTGIHDLRIVVVNGNIVWSHVRTPPSGSLRANVAAGGSIKEIDLEDIPTSIFEVVGKISERVVEKFDDPIFSIDFGINESGEPKVFEFNDQIGFPLWEMKNRDNFLNALVKNFESKLS